MCKVSFQNGGYKLTQGMNRRGKKERESLFVINRYYCYCYCQCYCLLLVPIIIVSLASGADNNVTHETKSKVNRRPTTSRILSQRTARVQERIINARSRFVSTVQGCRRCLIEINLRPR